ncbi:hypothetical protein MHYP_G00107030 [Metynnis hypsauchen]
MIKPPDVKYIVQHVALELAGGPLRVMRDARKQHLHQQRRGQQRMWEAAEGSAAAAVTAPSSTGLDADSLRTHYKTLYCRWEESMPELCNLRKEVLCTVHVEAGVGHFRLGKTVKLLQQRFYWLMWSCMCSSVTSAQQRKVHGAWDLAAR